MKPVITITANPCIDISAHVPALFPDKKLRCSTLKKDPGGGGINVSRVIHRFGGNTIAFFPAGGYTGDYFVQMLANEQVPFREVILAGETRENIVITDDSSGLQYKFGMPGPVVSEAEYHELLKAISLVKEASFFVLSGSLAQGMPEVFFAEVIKIARKIQAPVVADCAGAVLTSALKESVYLIKPNLGELASLAGVNELDKHTAIDAAKQVIGNKQAEVIIVSMGASGALLVTEQIQEFIAAPVIKTKSTVGAGDSMVAGIVFSLASGWGIEEAVKYGVACGTAATINEGTALCMKADADRLYQQM